MTKTTRIKIAALATALFIGGLVAAGIGLRSTPATDTAASPAGAVPTQSQPAASAASSGAPAAAARAYDGDEEGHDSARAAANPRAESEHEPEGDDD